MANPCSNRYAFYTTDENKDELLRLYNNISAVMETRSEIKNDYEPGWLGKIATCHGIDWEQIPCRGYIGHLDEYEPDSNFFTLEAETAWSPTEELWEAVIALYTGISFVYVAEESGFDIYINTDTEGLYLPDRYLLEIWGDAPIPESWYADQVKPRHLDIREYFENLDSIMDYCTKFTGKVFTTFEELQSYFFGIFDEESSVIVGVHEFTAA